MQYAKYQPQNISPLATGETSRPIRILHVVGGMNRGGIETWLMHLLRHIDCDRFKMDFLVHSMSPGAYDNEIDTLGSRIFQGPNPSKLWKYSGAFEQIIRQYGPYDIVHAHVHNFSGYVLRAAKHAGVPVRIAHSHNVVRATEKGLIRKAYLALSEYWILRYATKGIACSQEAAADLFGTHWEGDSRWRIIPYGIPMDTFQPPIKKSEIRASFNIPENAFVIGHVGRFVDQKNHIFILKIMNEVIAREPNSYLLLVGEGSLRTSIQRQVENSELANQVVFTGSRPDVINLMKGCMDVFLFPSLHEGLGLVLVEAQSAGLPIVCSDVIPEEADIIRPLIKRLPLSTSARAWAEEILACRDSAQFPNKEAALTKMKSSDFNIENSLTQLMQLYISTIN
jgi:glycosyltransferase involved in cell wall biosynthesis